MFRIAQLRCYRGFGFGPDKGLGGVAGWRGGVGGVSFLTVRSHVYPEIRRPKPAHEPVGSGIRAANSMKASSLNKKIAIEAAPSKNAPPTRIHTNKEHGGRGRRRR